MLCIPYIVFTHTNIPHPIHMRDCELDVNTGGLLVRYNERMNMERLESIHDYNLHTKINKYAEEYYNCAQKI